MKKQHGGARRGAGRPRTHPTGEVLHPITVWVTDREEEAILRLIEDAREQASQAASNSED
jgi:hypothetical protein